MLLETALFFADVIRTPSPVFPEFKAGSERMAWMVARNVWASMIATSILMILVIRGMSRARQTAVGLTSMRVLVNVLFVLSIGLIVVAATVVVHALIGPAITVDLIYGTSKVPARGVIVAILSVVATFATLWHLFARGSINSARS